MPVPMRIDKISNGEPTLFLLPDADQLNQVTDDLDIYIDYELFFSQGIRNLVSYAKFKYRELFKQSLFTDAIKKWFRKACYIDSVIPTLVQDFTYLIIEFLYLYTELDNLKSEMPGDQSEKMVNFCSKMVIYFRQRIENNEIEVKYKGLNQTVQIFKERRKKYYPLIVPFDVNDIENNRITQKNFVPYLIYDDIIEVFAYNKKLLEENPTIALNMQQIYQHNHIINKRSNITDPNHNFSLDHFKFQDINLSGLL